MDRQGWDERYSAREQTFVRDPNRLVVAEIDGLAPGRALVVATGEGRHAVWLASLGWQVVAVDFSVVGITRAAARARQEGCDVAFAAADVYALRLPPASLDLVLCSFFHPPPDQRRRLYPAVAAALAPGGSLVQVSYDVRNATEGTGGPKDPAMLIDPPVVAAELEALGMKVTRADTVRLRTPTMDGEEVDVVDAIIHAVKP
jgi:SAM-dependent methyltransferase